MEAVHGDGADGRERIPSVHGKLECPFVPVAALHNLDHQFRAIQHAGSQFFHFHQGTFRIPDTVHRPHRTAHRKGIRCSCLQRRALGKHQRGPRGILPGAHGILNSGRRGLGKGLAAVRADLQRGRAHGSGRGHTDDHIRIQRRIARYRGPGLSFRHRQGGNVTARLPLDRHSHHIRFLSARYQHVADTVHQRPRAQQLFQVRALADQVRLAHNTLGADACHQGLAVHAAGHDARRAVYQVLDYIAHIATSHDRRTSGGS